MIFRIINDALKYYGGQLGINIGELKGGALINASGKTSAGIQVWLPIIQSPKPENWLNKLCTKYGLDMVLQTLGPTGTNYNKPIVKDIAYHVITRAKTKTDYDYTYLGQYRFALFDHSYPLTVHVKIDPAKEQERLTRNTKLFEEQDDLMWSPGFAIDAEDARKKAGELYKEF